MKYTDKEKAAIEKLVYQFSLLENKTIRKGKVGWYSLASGIHDTAKTKQIMKDINAI